MTKLAPAAYRADLAYIHDTGFGQFATTAAPWLVELLDRQQRPAEASRLVIDLGCGSGIWAAAAVDAGYDVLGFDLSAAMVSLARRRVPEAEFRQSSFLDAELRPCVAVTALGEVFSYVFDRRNQPARLEKLLGRIYDALCPGGLLVFDVAAPGRVPGGTTRGYTTGHDWACLYTAHEDSELGTLVREITSFRRVGKMYRRSEETHRLRLFDTGELLTTLRGVGFRARVVSAYGEFVFPPGWLGFVCRKV